MTAQNRLRVSQLSASRGRKPVLQDVEFEVSGGQIVQILGANGSGKSTLLRILAGLAAPDAGKIFWNDTDSHAAGRDQYREACIYIGHKIGISNDQTALENLALFQQINMGREQMAPRDALKKMGYNASPDVLAHKTSAGQRQRIALAKLLVVKAGLWLLDEPFTALDKDGKTLLETSIREHCQNGGITVVATHQALGLPAELVTNLYLN